MAGSAAKVFTHSITSGAATPPPDSVLYPSFAGEDAAFLFVGDTTALEFYAWKLGDDWQHQINVTDNLSQVTGRHQMKFGSGYRRITSQNRTLFLYLRGRVPLSVQCSVKHDARGVCHLEK